MVSLPAKQPSLHWLRNLPAPQARCRALAPRRTPAQRFRRGMISRAMISICSVS
jgi:hypothetical protein